jgi:hypothetical protein
MTAGQISVVEKIGSREQSFSKRDASFKNEAFILGSDDDKGPGNISL